MVDGLWGKKIGMTQVFSDNKVVPVTVINVAHWRITQIKTEEKDGYQALQLGLMRPKYQDQDFSADWLTKPDHYFSTLCEVKVSDSKEEFALGQTIEPKALFSQGDAVDAFGISTGRGFQGVVKRYGWAGGRASHGSKFGRTPGSLGTCRKSGDVRKGKGLPGHMGVQRCVTKNLEIVQLDDKAPLILVKGSVPGKAGSLVFLRKRG